MTTSRSESVRSLARVIVALLACLLLGCRESPQAPPAPGIRSEDPPAGLVATFYVSEPEQLYALARAALVPTAPRALPVLLAHILGLQPDISGRFRTDRVVNGALSVDAEKRLGFAVGLPVTSGRELVAELTLGTSARFQAHSARRLTELRGAVVGPLGSLSLGVAGNLLIIGNSVRSLHQLGPYLATHAEPGALASEVTAPGIALRSVAHGTQLQAILASLPFDVWDEAAKSLAGSGSFPLAALHEHPLLHEVLAELMRTVSAYVGHLEASDATVLLDGNRIDLTWEGKASSLPKLRGDGRTACRDLASLPDGTRAWLLGVGRKPEAASTPTPPDWDMLTETWQRPLVEFMASVAGESGMLVSDAATLPPATSAPWLLSWYDNGNGAALLGVFRGLPSETFSGIISRPHQLVTLEPQASVTKRGVVREGKSLEVAWSPRGAGVASSSGAPLGKTWLQFAREPDAVQAPSFMSPRVCEQLVAAIGYANAAHLAVSRTAVGLRADGKVDLRILAKTTP